MGETVTVPEQPTTGEIMRGIGRIENGMDALSGRFDRLDEKHDTTTTEVGRHDERIGALERAGQRTWERVGLWLTVVAALVAAIIPHPWK